MELAELKTRFAIPGVLDFEVNAAGLVAARIDTQQARATVYLQGAHLTDWHPTGHKPVLFLSAKSDFEPGKPIRGGVPVIFPWFGPRHDGKAGPTHGFARTAIWDVAFAALAGDDLHITFTLEPNDSIRSLGFDGFRLAYQMTIGKALTLQLTVANDPGPAGVPLVFEEALHTYLAVDDARGVEISGLSGTTYIDKRDDLKRKVLPPGPLAFSGATDRVFLDTASTCTIEDSAGHRKIHIEKSGSDSTVLWNPWTELTPQLPDMEPDGWMRMTCVETANVAGNTVTLAPGATHTMSAKVTVEELG